MILACGIPSEPPVRLVLEAAEALGVETVVLNQRDARHVRLAVRAADGRLGGTLGLGGRDHDLDSFGGIYVRLMDHRDLPESRLASSGPAAAERSAFLHELLHQWLEVCPARVMCRPGAMASNGSKPYQAQLITQAGFRVPDTIVTTDPDAVHAFERRHGRVVFKSISSARSVVKMLAAPDRARLDRIRRLATQFQAYVPGTNVRAHVVGDEIFATEIETGAVDYRYAGQDGAATRMRPVDLPGPVATRCLGLSRALRLPLCGIDLKRTPEGEWVCFEVNPSPGFSWFQEETGQDIAGAIVRWLDGRS